jgi:putative heme iron utilization protein
MSLLPSSEVEMALCVWLEDEMQRVDSCAGVTERPRGYANSSQRLLLYQKQQFEIFNKRMSIQCIQ